MKADLTQTFLHHHKRLTQPRVKIFDVLTHQKEPVSLHTIQMAVQDIDRVTVYRTLELFSQLGIVDVVHIGWKKRYELANTYQEHHHHHLACQSCGVVTEINSTTLETVIQTITTEYEFTATGHTFEINGLCKNCRT